MKNHHKILSVQQASSAIDALCVEAGLVFKDTFSTGSLEVAAAKHVPDFRDRIFSPVTTLLAFLGQVLSADKSCSGAVARVNSDRISLGLKPGSPDTGGYCKARDRLPEAMIKEVYIDTASEISKAGKALGSWKGRDVKVTDGTTATMADTFENREAYGIGPNQQDEVGFPLTRLVTIFSLFTGCSLDFANDAYRGKETGEHALLRKILDCLNVGDVLLGDAYFASYFLIAQLQQRGVDAVFHADGKRPIDFREGKRLGKLDHVVAYQKPAKPEWMSQEIYETMPEQIEVRECCVSIDRPGFRSRKILIISSILNPDVAQKSELGDLYRLRWMAELYFASIKTSLKMDHIRSKTPEMVQKEICTTLLAYNLIRKLMFESAINYHVLPCYLSFKGAVQTVNEYKSLRSNSTLDWEKVYDSLLEAISRIRVGNRPNRVEPRAVKKRPKPFPRLKQSRSKAREAIQKKTSKILDRQVKVIVRNTRRNPYEINQGRFAEKVFSNFATF